MKITRKEFEQSKNIYIDQDLDFEENAFSLCKDIISVKNVHVIVDAKFISELVLMKIKVIADLILRSSRSLKPVPYVLKDNQELTLAFEESELTKDGDIIILDKDEFDVSQEVLSMIITSLPYKIVGKDEPTSIKEETWELISEDEYNKRKSNQGDPRFSALDDLDLDL